MGNKLNIYNTINRKKEIFAPINPPFTGLYVCGPTVYGDAHLGHARPAITFDVVFRYLTFLGYKVRYVRNITDVGHLENDADEGEDKIAKKARLEQLEPMEVVHHYTNTYHNNLEKLNCKSPSIEPRASGHIIEQQEMIDKIIENGFAYIADGSVYFDVEKYNEHQKKNDPENSYGKLSGRVLEDLMSNTRELAGQSVKRNPFDFALWKSANSEHIMRWSSKWSDGFPGWHLECSVMSTLYLGDQFDIHGGGMDLLFPHHECEIAQSLASNGKASVKYWMHNNMITIDGQKMGKSLNNFITLDEFFEGSHKALDCAYSPMTVRFFILQAHYRSTLDFSNKALKAADKGFQRLMSAIDTLNKIKPSAESTNDIEGLRQKCIDAMNDDFNTPIAIAHLFDGVKMINSFAQGTLPATESDIEALKELYNTLVFDILGLRNSETGGKANDKTLNNVVALVLNIRQEAKEKKDWGTADKIRNELNDMGFVIKDSKDGAEWELNPKL